MTSIGSSAFFGCSNLTEINYNAAAVADWTSDSNVFYNAGSNSDGITVIFGESVTSIPAYLFCVNASSSRAPNLVSVTIGSNVESIGRFAFSDCSSLSGVYISDLVAWCAIEFGGSSANPLYYAGNLYLNDELVTELVIPEGVTSIGSYVFRSCSSLTEVMIGAGVTSIGSSAFYGCSNLTEINYNAMAVADLTSDSNVFYNAGSVSDGTTVIFGESVTSIPAYLFVGADITSVTIGSYVESIGSSAFRDCSGLTEITIPASVTSIGTDAFFGCSNLTGINYNATAVADLTSDSNVFYNTGSNSDGITVVFGESVTDKHSCLFVLYKLVVLCSEPCQRDDRQQCGEHRFICVLWL